MKNSLSKKWRGTATAAAPSWSSLAPSTSCHVILLRICFRYALLRCTCWGHHEVTEGANDSGNCGAWRCFEDCCRHLNQRGKETQPPWSVLVSLRSSAILPLLPFRGGGAKWQSFVLSLERFMQVLHGQNFRPANFLKLRSRRWWRLQSFPSQSTKDLFAFWNTFKPLEWSWWNTLRAGYAKQPNAKMLRADPGISLNSQAELWFSDVFWPVLEEFKTPFSSWFVVPIALHSLLPQLRS